MPESAHDSAPRWDLFCRVVDNFGDIGVCWRLACALAAQGQAVRLFCDDTSALTWMAPAGHGGVQVLAWPADDDAHWLPGDVVVEAFGCNPPAAFVACMARRAPNPVWINLEYLSAEPYVERSHGLPSPQANGLTKWFFYPGFTPRTGGLLREPGLLAARAAFDRAAWLKSLDLSLQPGERLVSLFCYRNPALPALLQRLADAPTLLLATPG
ncbi:MAG: elongation factor P maturation arginine rhamnosyltransferase EarP, partial [Chitinophagaceae bacterium]|nr:elongation factor P maturation arginine rhamnosyltransferase EarP [Rubrivivax sp.]